MLKQDLNVPIICIQNISSFYLTDISAWMRANMFILNQEKTRLIIFRLKHQMEINEEIQKTVCGVVFVKKNGGAYFDTSLTTERQIGTISKACYYQIRNIGHIGGIYHQGCFPG